MKPGDVCPLVPSGELLDVLFACESAAASAPRWTVIVS